MLRIVCTGLGCLRTQPLPRQNVFVRSSEFSVRTRAHHPPSKGWQQPDKLSARHVSVNAFLYDESPKEG
jgi:hypothetical protein